MFGPGLTALALAVLVMLSTGGVAYALFYGRINGNPRVDKRITDVRSRKLVDPIGRIDPSRRRKSVQETLKELDERQLAKAKQNNSPPLMLRLQQAGLGWSKRTYFLFSAGAAFGFALVGLILGLPLYALAAVAVAGGFAFPRWFVNFLRKRRFKKFVAEFPNAVDVVVRGVKAGLPLNDCLRIIASEAADPVKTEFRAVNETQALGMSLADAVQRMPERVPIPEAKFFAIVIAIQQQAGGNLTEALGNLSRVLRERKKMKGKIGAMSMEAKASAVIIGALPIVVMFLVYLSSPDYISLLFTEPMGNVILGCSAVWMAIGIFVMKRMINFDY